MCAFAQTDDNDCCQPFRSSIMNFRERGGRAGRERSRNGALPEMSLREHRDFLGLDDGTAKIVTLASDDGGLDGDTDN
ncbi:Protein of unknown function [Gryllus bimaculatus]|nr:Protein of unknown function [Gryllus bimaculatus]